MNPADIPGGQLVSTDAAARMILSGRALRIAGEESALRKLPKGLWIGGSIPYFMTTDGGLCCQERVYVAELPAFCGVPSIGSYDVDSISGIACDAPENGFSVLIVPAFTDVHERFARDAPEFEQMYERPLVGWVSGLHLDDLSDHKPVVVMGPTGEFFDDQAVAMHVPLSDQYMASVELVNLFQPGDGPVIQFDESGFGATQAFVDGQAVNLASYLQDNQIDTRLPLVADYCGAAINVSFQTVDHGSGNVTFYAPVFAGVEYRLAAPLDSYADALVQEAEALESAGTAFCCNCILNYLYGELEGRTAGHLNGPMTFGEIAYQLVNQTLVRLRVEQV